MMEEVEEVEEETPWPKNKHKKWKLIIAPESFRFDE